MLFLEAGGETEVRKFDVAVAVEKDVVGLDVAVDLSVLLYVLTGMSADSPMDVVELVNSLKSAHKLCHVEPSDVF